MANNPTQKLQPKLLFLALIHSFCTSFSVGFHLSVVNNPADLLQDFIDSSYKKHYGHEISGSRSSALWGFTVNVYVVGGAIGAWIAMYMAEKFGRKTSLMLINNVITIIGSILLGVSKPLNSFEVFIVGRFLNGISSGIGTGILPLYLTECSPTEFRGMISSFENMFITLTSFFAAIVSLEDILGTDSGWPYMMAMGVIPAILQMIIAPISPESPKFLYLEKGDEEAAKKSVKFYYGHAENVEKLFEEFKEEKNLASSEIGFVEAMKQYKFRYPIIMSSIINVAMITSGIMVMFSYSTEIFENAGFDNKTSQYSTLVMSGFNSLGAFAVLPLMDRVGRRPLMLSTLTITIVCCCIFLIFTQIQNKISGRWPSYFGVAAIVVHVTAFNMGVGPITWFISSELMPQNVRSIGASVSITVNWLASVIITEIFLPLQDAVDTYCFLLFIIPTALATVYLYFRMPETRNRTIDEIMATWTKRVPLLENSSIQSKDSNAKSDEAIMRL